MHVEKHGASPFLEEEKSNGWPLKGSRNQLEEKEKDPVKPYLKQKPIPVFVQAPFLFAHNLSIHLLSILAVVSFFLARACIARFAQL